MSSTRKDDQALLRRLAALLAELQDLEELELAEPPATRAEVKSGEPESLFLSTHWQCTLLRQAIRRLTELVEN